MIVGVPFCLGVFFALLAVDHMGWAEVISILGPTGLLLSLVPCSAFVFYQAARGARRELNIVFAGALAPPGA